jgi:hypothetical protein
MKLYGLMITKDDHEVFDEWCTEQLPLYDAVVCLDGSNTDSTARLARPYARKVIYLHERDFCIAHKTDHRLRALVHEAIVQRFGHDGWIMCCHADEFCYHDPRKLAFKAEREGFDLVAWFSLHFYPHESEYGDWDVRRRRPLVERFRHYHWDYRGSGLPWCEDRLYRNGPGTAWDGVSHGNVRPLLSKRPAPFHPILRHYKVFTLNMEWYETTTRSTFYRHHWAGQEHRTGLPFLINRPEQLFVRSVPPYLRCDRFDGVIPFAWNIGEEYRPENSEPLAPLR